MKRDLVYGGMTLILFVLLILGGTGCAEVGGLRFPASEEVRQQPAVARQAAREIDKVVARVGNPEAIDAVGLYTDLIEGAADVESADDGLPKNPPDIADIPSVKAAQAEAAQAAGKRPTVPEQIEATTKAVTDTISQTSKSGTDLLTSVKDNLALILASIYGVGATWTALRKNAQATANGQALQQVVTGVDAAKATLSAEDQAKLKAALGTATDEDVKNLIYSLRATN